jgi:hypothetical protein
MANNLLFGKQYVNVFGAGTVHSDGTAFSREITNYYHKGIFLMVNRTAETGTCTLDAQIQWRMPSLTTWENLENASIVQMANSAIDLVTLWVYPGIIGGDADGTLAVNTAHKHVDGYLPLFWRVAVTTGGTGVTNTFGMDAILLP